ncbi:hypothetical protein [Anaerotignum sp. MSJ-24]|jgi:hypothetical protein|uniref:hypothetical protein n=1 Tax=Anaerotignum sp. MSJ-24 TaxID=2841521 RepID=UPI001C106ED7|nr:hypothetical protein [Anaerotignum sp. MSJ-24]MBU5464949.1 hypothetical protein [Anaerotignum sp. MSJ-24]
MKITPEIVGRELGVTAATVRRLMDAGKLNIGIVEIHKERNTYIILPKMLYEATGIKIDYEPPAEIDYQQIAAAVAEIIGKGA